VRALVLVPDSVGIGHAPDAGDYGGTDHTREQVPLLVLHGNKHHDLGLRLTFGDIAATLAEFFQLREHWPVGVSFLMREPCTSRR